MRDRDKKLLRAIMGDKDRWLYRALIMAKALEALGIDAQWLQRASKLELESLIFESPESTLRIVVTESLRNER